MQTPSSTSRASRGRLGVLVAFVAVAAACATTARYDRELESWVGQDVDDLVHSWGPPTESTLRADGNTLLTWVHDESFKRPVPTKSITYGYTIEASRSARMTVAAWCHTTFTVAPSGRLLGWRREGNHCTSR